MAKGKAIKETTPEEKVNPSDAMIQEDSKKVRAPGNWVKATKEQLAQHEADGTLLGYDPKSGHVLLKEE